MIRKPFGERPQALLHIMPQLVRRYVNGILGAIFFVMIGACGGASDDFIAVTDPSILLKAVRLREHAYNLATNAPYDTVQLFATAVLADGAPAPGVFRYSVSDTIALAVDSTGLLRARQAVTGWVRVAMTYHGLTRTDSLHVSVVDGPPVLLNRIALTPLPGDSVFLSRQYPEAIQNVAEQQALALHAFDVNDVEVSTLPVMSYASSDTTVARFNNIGLRQVVGVREGTTWLYASAVVYGRVLRDSLRYRVGALLFQTVFFQRTVDLRDGVLTSKVVMQPDSLDVVVGTDVNFNAQSLCFDAKGAFTFIDPFDITFDDPTAAHASARIMADPVSFVFFDRVGGSGNMTGFQCDYVHDPIKQGSEVRLFTTPGKYPFHTSLGHNGVIVVR